MPCCCAVQLSVGLTAAGLHCGLRRRVQACTICASVHPSAARDASSGESHATATKHSSFGHGCVISMQGLCNWRDAFRGAQLGVRLRGKQSAVIVASRGAFCACGADSSHGPSTHWRCAHWQTHCGACFVLAPARRRLPRPVRRRGSHHGFQPCVYVFAVPGAARSSQCTLPCSCAYHQAGGVAARCGSAQLCVPASAAALFRSAAPGRALDQRAHVRQQLRVALCSRAHATHSGVACPLTV